MPYNPATDFVGLWRNNGSDVAKLEMPGLDFVVAALARAGLITLSVSATPPVANQSTTAWLQAAVPSYSAEGVMYLWNPATSAYEAATPALLFRMLQTSTGQNGVSWWTAAGGPPLNTVGNDGDYSFRTDPPNGIYGPKAAGVWPSTPIPGTADVITSTALDNTFGAVEGQLIVRGAAVWEPLPVGTAKHVLGSNGTVPIYFDVSTLLDLVFGINQGSLLYRSAAAWEVLLPGLLGQVLSSGGVAANPSWQPRTAEFPSGTRMIFQQTLSPPGWTKDVTINDYGLRVVSGAVGAVAGSAFSTVFAQTQVGNTTLTEAQMPNHVHDYQRGIITAPAFSGGGINGVVNDATTATASKGGSTAHTHSVNLSLSYTDVIIARKD